MSSTLWMFTRGSNVIKLQKLLNKNKAFPKIAEDGIFGQDTYNAVKVFQRHNGLKDDGIAGPQTWRKLDVQDTFINGSSTCSSTTPSASLPVNSNDTVAETSEEFCFPFPKIPEKLWTSGGRQFGAPRIARDGSVRRHAGCDLIFPVGTPIYAVADGVLVQNPYPFYSGTYAVEIRHGNLLLRYGEIAPGSCPYTRGSSVKKGQIIAKVGRLQSGSSMLHLEIYTNGASSASLSGGGPFRRRSDVTDPAPYLNLWKNNLPRP